MAEASKNFVCVRVVDMKGVDLNVYDFDWDLTWYAFFMTPAETELARFGARDDASATSFLSLDSLKTAMDRALEQFKAWKPGPEPGRPARRPDTPEGRGIKADKQGCIHCHMIRTNDWQARQAKNKWSRDEIWMSPLPANLGFELDPKNGTTAKAVAKGSAAEKAGAKAGDDLVKIDGRSVRTFADAVHALDLARKMELEFVVLRGGKEEALKLKPAADWRKTDLSWRESAWQIPPKPGVWFEDLSDADRDKAKLGKDVMALRVRQIFDANSAAPKAGLIQGDVVVSINGDKSKMNPQHFNVLLRVDIGPGKKVTLKVLRGGQPKDIVFTQ